MTAARAKRVWFSGALVEFESPSEMGATVGTALGTLSELARVYSTPRSLNRITTACGTKASVPNSFFQLSLPPPLSTLFAHLNDGTMSHALAVIVGVGRGMGASCARAFASKGLSVAILARNADSLKAIADSINASGGIVRRTQIPLLLQFG